MLSRPTNTYLIKGYLTERAIYIELARQHGTFSVKINLETAQKF